MAEITQEEEEESPPDELLGYVHQIFQDFSKQVTDLNNVVTTVKTKTDTLLELTKDTKFLETGPEQTKFMTALGELSEYIGHAGWEVLEIELRRQGVIGPGQDMAQILPNPDLEKTVNPSVLVNAAETQQKGGGFFDYMRGRSYAAIYEKYLKTKEMGTKMTPDISTAKEVIDILEFGRQLIPELNMVQDYYRQSIDHLYFFDDVDTKERFHSEIATHLGKIGNIIRTFTQISVDHRIENVGERKRAVAMSVIMLKLAELNAMGQMKLGDWYKSLKQAAGDQDAGTR